MDVARYLNRIRYAGRLDVSARTLRDLHRAHMFTVPFENLDIPLGRPIVLDEARLLKKVVDDCRGGFCYELNGAFAALLRALGFHVTMLSAGVARPEGGFDPPFDHMALMVRLEQRWLADVGFGDSFTEPLLLDERREQSQPGGVYRVSRALAAPDRPVTNDEEVILESRDKQGVWTPQYRFTLQSYELGDFAEMCNYHQTSPQSIFTQKRTCTIATAAGRITLSGVRLITNKNRERSEVAIETAEQYREAVRTLFGFELTIGDAERLIAGSARQV